VIYPVPIGSVEAFGAASLEFQTVRPPSISIPEPVAVLPLGIGAGSFGQTLVGPALAPAGFGGEAFGQSTLKVQLLASAIASVEAFGAAQMAPADWLIAVLPVQ
jgi:hypothetical protein